MNESLISSTLQPTAFGSGGAFVVQPIEPSPFLKCSYSKCVQNRDENELWCVCVCGGGVNQTVYAVGNERDEGSKYSAINHNSLWTGSHAGVVSSTHL